MSKRSQLIDFLRSNPNKTNREIADALGWHINTVASMTTVMFQSNKIKRAEGSKTLTGTSVWVYSAPDVLPTASASTKLDNGLYSHSIASSKKNHSSMDTLVNQVAAQIAKSLASQIKRRLLVELEGMIPAVTREPEVDVLEVLAQPPKPVEIPKPVTRLRKIGITGLLPQQAGLIMQEFSDTFDITFWNDRQGDSTAKLKSLGIGSEVVFMHTDHASHNHGEVLKSVGAKIVIVRGGMTHLRDALTRYYVEEVQ